MTTPDEDITGYGGLPQSGSTPDSAAPVSSHGAADADLKAKAREVGDEVKQQGKAQLDSYRGTAADELEKVARSAQAAADELQQQDNGLSTYVSEMAQGMVELADNLRGKSVDELVGEVNRLARNNPALFIAGSIAVGFGLTRFARASGQRAQAHEPTVDYGHFGRPAAASDLAARTRQHDAGYPRSAEPDGARRATVQRPAGRSGGQRQQRRCHHDARRCTPA